MPAAFAHLTFGRNVLKTLPEGEVQRVIKSYPELFEIGLQGPDILFFYQPLKRHPVNRLGHGLHDRTCLSFLDREVCRGANDAGAAYLLGLVCHFALDSECHTLVEYFMEVTGKEHSDVETDLERELMRRGGLDPLRHAPSTYVSDTAFNAEVIAPFYGLDGKTLKTALSSMKLVGRLLTPGNRLKHAVLTFATERMGKRSLPRQLVMDWTPDPVYDTSNRVLIGQLEHAIPVAVALMENFQEWKRGNCELSDRFDRTFSFNPEELDKLRGESAYV